MRPSRVEVEVGERRAERYDLISSAHEKPIGDGVNGVGVGFLLLV